MKQRVLILTCLIVVAGSVGFGQNLAPSIFVSINDGTGEGATEATASETPTSISFAVGVNDPDNTGKYGYQWTVTKLSGTFCPGESFTIFGASAAAGLVQLGRMSTLARWQVSVTVSDGPHSVSGSKTVWTKADSGGCSSGGGSGGAPSGLSLSTSPQRYSPGQPLTVSANATSATTVTFRLFASSTFSKPASPFYSVDRTGCDSGCTVQVSYTAWSDVRFWLDVTNTFGTTSRVLTVTQTSSGGGTSPPPTGGSSCEADTISVKSNADNSTFKISESEKDEALAAGDLNQESIFVGGVGFVDSFNTDLTQAAFLALYDCVEEPAAYIQYRFSGGSAQNAQNGATIQRSVTSFPETIELVGVGSNLTSPVYSWQVAGVGTLSASSGPSVNLQIASLPSGAGSSTVTVTASESGDPSVSVQASLTFQLTTSIIRSVQLGYTFSGQTQQTANNGTVVARNISQFPETMQFQALQQNFTSPLYTWQVTGTGSLNSNTGQTSSLEVAGFQGTSASAAVLLKVTESSDPSTFVEITVTFQFTAPAVSNPPTSVDFSVSPQGGVEANTLLVLTGVAQSGIGSSFQALNFNWSAALDGTPVLVMTNRERAVVQVPSNATETSVFEVELVVSEGGNQAPAVVKTIDVVSAELNFAHFGVGPVNGQEQLVMELVVVNDTEVDQDALLELTSSQGDPLVLDIGGNAVSSYAFNVLAGGAETLTLKSPDEGIWTGWFKLGSTAQLNAIVLFRTENRDTLEVYNEVALFPSTSGRRFTTALRPGPNDDLGIAVANITGNQVEFEVTLTEIVDGEKVFSMTENIELSPMGQTAMFLPEIFVRRGVPIDFAGGILTLEVPVGIEGGLIATILRQNAESLSTVPLAVRSD